MKTTLNRLFSNLKEILMRNFILELLFLFVILFSILSPSFFTITNLASIVTQNSSVIIMAAGLTFIIVSGGIDLSLGYQISLVSVTVGMLLALGVNIWVAIISGILVGVLCGVFNALIIIGLRIPPFAATLATSLIFKSISNLISGGRAYTQLPDALSWLTKNSLWGIPNYAYIAVFCLLLYGLIVSLTYFGCYIKAVGENEQAVRRIGINVNLVKLFCYVIGSFFFSIQALIITFRQGIASPSTGAGMEIIGITAVFLGVDSSYRNKNTSVWGAMFHLLIGVLILAVLENGLLLTGWNQHIQDLIRGLLLIFAITFYYREKPKTLKTYNRLS